MNVVIPTRSNPEGLQEILEVLKDDPVLNQVVVVFDGYECAPKYPFIGSAEFDHLNLRVGSSANREGIHAMWNLGMHVLSEFAFEDHVLFLNDDVTINEYTLMGLQMTLDAFPHVGLCCPTYAPTRFGRDETLKYVRETCGGRYDGTGGLAGFAMALDKELISFRFDERMKWWYGDDDLMNSVLVQGREVAITRLATCSGNQSKTINGDRPPNFDAIVAEDRRIYLQKWATK